MEIKLAQLDWVGKTGIITVLGGIASTAAAHIVESLSGMEDFTGVAISDSASNCGEQMITAGPLTIAAGVSLTALSYRTTKRKRNR